MTFDPQRYWNDRLSDNFTFSGVGDIRFARSYNRVLYDIRRRVFLSALRELRVSAGAPEVLDVGSGIGFYLGLWKRFGARSVAASDITTVAVEKLGEKHPETDCRVWDVGGEACPFGRTFDIVSAFDVFFHITDDHRFRRAANNVAACLKPGGLFLYSDYFMREEQRAEHIVFRENESILAAFRDAGLTPVLRRPVFWMMNTPLVTRNRVPRRLFAALSRLAVRGEIAGWLAGHCALPWELLMIGLGCGPTGTEFVAFRKGKDGEA